MTAMPLDRRDWWTAGALAVVVLAAGSLRIAPGVCGVFHDDAIYVSTAESLATGQGYRLIDVPGAPLQTKYPPLYPVVLAMVWKAWPDFPANLPALQGITLLFAAATVAGAYLYLVRFRYVSRSVAAAAGLICATGSYFLYFAVHTMAEMPFAFCSLLALWGLEHFLQRSETSRRGQFGGGILLALPFLCRTIGATLIVSGLLVLLLHRRPLRWYLLGVVCTVAPWLAFSSLGRGVWAQNQIEGYYTDYFGCWSSTGLSLTGQVVFRNALMAANGSGDLALEAVSANLEPVLGRSNAFFLMMIVGLVPWLAMGFDLRRNRALPWMLLGYLGAMLVWPWPPYRFLVPILPLLIAYGLSAPSALARHLPAPVAVRWAGVMAVAAIIAANASLLAWHHRQLQPSGPPLLKHTDPRLPWEPYQRAFAWLRNHSQPREVVATWYDSMLARYTDRRSFRPFVYDPGPFFYGQEGEAAFSAEDLAAALTHYQACYLLQTPLPGCAEDRPVTAAIEELRRLHPRWLVIAYQDADPRFVLFRLDPQHAPQGAARHMAAKAGAAVAAPSRQ